MLETLRNLLYIFQLEEYNSSRFLQWAKTHKKFKELEKKKKLNWTLKARLLFVLGLVFNLLTLGKKPVFALILASFFLSPFEGFAKITLVSLARIKMRRMKNLKVIGITGSFGKTSTKEILAQILEKKLKVLKTPQNYNTPLGIAKIILKNLSKEHEVFIVEMGAYKKGEIKKLCSIAKPNIGILTGITQQHLERFKTLKNIILAKSELIQSLPKKGTAVINLDSHPCQKLAEKIKIPAICYSTSQKLQTGNFIAAQNINLTRGGTSFILITNLNKKAHHAQIDTPLLGKQNVSNILASLAVALRLGLGFQDIKEAVANLTPIPHRLEVIKKDNTIIINDTYSANPAGIKAALEVLSLFKDRPKVIITPGLVELGSEQFKENFKMGKLIGRASDFVIVVGKTNKKALISGASSFKNIEEDLFGVPNLEEATKKLQELGLSAPVILFENDLPDQYQ